MYPYRTLQSVPYNREKALAYARKWALKRNPAYYDFEFFGGDCTNFASQVIYTGSGVMNYTPTFGWYYVNSYNRTPSWTGVDFLYNFLAGNEGQGPYVRKAAAEEIQPGDIIQLSFRGDGHFDHTLVVVKTGKVPGPDNILIATHTYDRDDYPLSEYTWKEIRYLHIMGARK